MKEDSMVESDGFGVIFYKECWETIKGELMEMINDFYVG
jgi:hypothetical protein